MKMNSRGQGLTEYMMLLTLVALFTMGTVQMFGKNIKNKIEKANKTINGQMSVDWEKNK